MAVIVVTAAAFAVGALALYVGGGWGIVILELAGAILASVILLRSGPGGEDNDAAG